MASVRELKVALDAALAKQNDKLMRAVREIYFTAPMERRASIRATLRAHGIKVPTN